MKTKILILIICVCPVFMVQAQEWEYVNSIQDEWMNKVYAQGAVSVFIVGEQGLIAKSTDRALTWNKQYFPNQATLNDIIFYDDNIGFIVGNNGTILKTEDAGITWRQITIESMYNINAIAATDLNDIWAVGNNSLIIHSSDAGESWMSISLLSNSCNLHDIKFKENIGFITGQGGKILKTENNGISWHEQELPDTENLPEWIDIRSLNIVDNKVFALVGEHFGGAIISAIDNNNWSYISDYEDIRLPHSLSGIYFQDEYIGYAATIDWTTGSGWGMWIFKTTDAGERWEEANIGPFWTYSGEISHYSNFSFSATNEFGYFLNRQILLRTPYTGEFGIHGELNEIESEKSDLFVKQQGNELQISSVSKTISCIEIITPIGVKLLQDNQQLREVNLNIESLPNGIYLLYTIFTDRTNEVIKWIKR